MSRPRLLCRLPAGHAARVDTEEQRDQHHHQAADAAADREPRPPIPPPEDVVDVSIRIPSLKVIASPFRWRRSRRV